MLESSMPVMHPLGGNTDGRQEHEMTRPAMHPTDGNADGRVGVTEERCNEDDRGSRQCQGKIFHVAPHLAPECELAQGTLPWHDDGRGAPRRSAGTSETNTRSTSGKQHHARKLVGHITGCTYYVADHWSEMHDLAFDKEQLEQALWQVHDHNDVELRSLEATLRGVQEVCSQRYAQQARYSFKQWISDSMKASGSAIHK